MKHPISTSSQGSSPATAPQDEGFSLWRQLKGKRISYLTLPLLVMATVTEFVILATGWKYQQVVCLPQGMGVTFFGIGPIGATILAVELLKLPLAIWTASRQGFQKGLMLVVGLPLICLLTFQLVKDMAVYEMGVALNPATQMLEKATDEEVKISQLSGALADIEGKKVEREHKLAELAAKQAKAKADLEDSLKRNADVRQDAISLTDYQKKELADMTVRQTTIIQQFNADTEQINKSLADLRARRETELAQDTKWNAEQARIDNAYKAKLAAFTNKKAAYEKARAEYDHANFLKRELMSEPVDPGVPPEPESNTMLKSALLADIEAQIKAKEAELLAVNSRRREQVAQVAAEADRLRDEFDRRSGTKREEADHKRDDLATAQATLVTEWKAEQKQIDQDLATAVQKVDGIRAELDASRKRAEVYYEAREAAIRNTQVHRIATTVEIVRGLLKGERPMSIKASAKERGDILTDQISMVRIWVYPVLAFIVAFLPTLMVEIGFSTLFHPEKQRPAYRLGFFGRHLHWLYIRAGRQKILRAERLAKEVSTQIAARDNALAAASAVADRALAEKDAELQAAREAVSAAATKNEEQLKRKEEEWVAKLAGMADSLNRTVVEKDALRDLQKSEIERQIQMRQNAWSDRLTQLRQELDDQRAASETERTALMQEHQKKLLEVSETGKTQFFQARRQAADAELAAVEGSAKLSQELKEALHARDEAEAQLQQQADSFSLKLSQAREDAGRELEKAARQEKHRLERQQLEFGKTLRQHEEDFERQLAQREQSQAQAELHVNEMQAQAEQELRRQELDLERRFEAQSREASARLKQEFQQKELAFEARLKQREQELAIRAEARETELQNQWNTDLRVREEEWERRADSRIRATEARLGHEAEQKEELLLAKSRQRDQQWQVKLDAARGELQAQNEEALRRRGAEAEASVRELEARLRKEMQQQDEAAQAKARQREQNLTLELGVQAEGRRLAAQAQWEAESEMKLRTATEPLKAQLARAEKERDEARQSSSESTRHVQHLEKKLTEASSFLNTWRNGKNFSGRPDEKVGDHAS